MIKKENRLWLKKKKINLIVSLCVFILNFVDLKNGAQKIPMFAYWSVNKEKSALSTWNIVHSFRDGPYLLRTFSSLMHKSFLKKEPVHTDMPVNSRCLLIGIKMFVNWGFYCKRFDRYYKKLPLFCDGFWCSSE